MDFEFTEEQRLLRESLDRLLGDGYGFDKRKSYIAEPEGFSRAMWEQYAEMGLARACRLPRSMAASAAAASRLWW